MLLGVLNKKNTDQPFIIYLCMKIERLEMDDVIHDENDIDMLIAMSLADVQAVNSTWYVQMMYCKGALKKDVMDLNGLN